MKTQIRQSSAQPNQLRRDEVHIQHDPNSNRIHGIWAGSKNDERKCVIPKKLAYPGDGNDYQMLPEDKYAGADTTSSVATITLPDVSLIEDGHEVIVEDDGGNAGANAITVATEGSESADTTSISTNGGKIHYMWDKANSNWKDVS